MNEEHVNEERLYKISPDGTLRARPPIVAVNGVLVHNPDAERLRCLPLDPSEPPEVPDDGSTLRTAYEWRDKDGKATKLFPKAVAIRAVYEVVPPPPPPEPVPPPPRTFSKLKLYAALAKAGLWDALKSWLESQNVDGVNAYTAFSLAQDLSESHPLFASWFAAAKAALGVSDADAEAMLAASAAEEAG